MELHGNNYIEIAPIAFLEKRISRKPSVNEMLLLHYITENYQFTEEVTNVLVEQALLLNNHKFTRGFTLKMADDWKDNDIACLTSALEHAKKEHEKFLQFQNRTVFGESRQLTVKEKEIINRIFYKSQLEDEIFDLVISYSMKINDGYIISWFINRVAEYVERHQPQNKEAAELLLHQFHQTYVLHFGLEK